VRVEENKEVTTLFSIEEDSDAKWEEIA